MTSCFVACVLGWLAVVALGGCSHLPRQALPQTAALLEKGNQPVRVVCFGDSITGVYWHTGSRRAYPELLASALAELYPQTEIEVYNAGVSGNTAQEGLARFQDDVLDYQPHLVTVAFGMNDCGRCTEQEYEADLREIVRRCRDADIEVMFCTPNCVVKPAPVHHPPEKLARFVHVMLAVADDLGVPVFDSYALFSERREQDNPGWRLLMNDTVHPNLLGHQLIAEGITQVISGRAHSLSRPAPGTPRLPHVLDRVRSGQPVRVLAMTPLDRAVADALGRLGDGAVAEVTPWKADGKTLEQLIASAGPARSGDFDLVVVSLPVGRDGRLGGLERAGLYAALLDRCLPWARGAGEWDVVAMPVAERPDDPPSHAQLELARQMIRAKDILGPDWTGCETPDDYAVLLADWFESAAGQEAQP